MMAALCASVVAATPRAGAAPLDDACGALPATLAVEVREASPASALTLLAPRLGPSASEGLLERARRAPGAEAGDLFLAAGLTRQSAALPRLRAVSRAALAPEARLGLALGLLALGDPARTATIAGALTTADPGLRRRTAGALARIPGLRARALLARALEDPEPGVRATAALALDGTDRAGAVLREVVDRPELGRRLGRRVRRALAAPPASPGSAARLRKLLRGEDAEARAAALGSLAARPVVAPAVLRRLVEQAGAAPSLRAEVSMALALAGEKDGLAALVTAGPADAVAALRVLEHAARAVGEPLGDEVAAALAAALSPWIDRAVLARPGEASLLRALRVLAPPAATAVARAWLARGDARGFAPAVETLARAGDRADVPGLLGLAARSRGRARARAYAAAARICAR